MRAIILAAGLGSRLGAITQHVPKPLIQVDNKPIIQYQLEALHQAGIFHCTIVLGHLGYQLREQLGDTFSNVKIEFVENPLYRSTNNIYSLWLALKEAGEDDIMLLEGDLVFEAGLIMDLVYNGKTDVAVADRFSGSMNGTAILSQGDRISSMILRDQQTSDFDYNNALKTVNIYVLSNMLVSTKLLPAIAEYVLDGRVGDFYESVLSELIKDKQIKMSVQSSEPHKWIEIDTQADLAEAQYLFHES